MIIRNPNHIELKANGKEKLEDELYRDGFIVNQADISDYLMKCIIPHWHDELEIFVLDSGQCKAELNGTHFTLSKGEGCFVNQDILHSFEAITKEAHFRSFVFHSSFISGIAGSVFDLNYISPLLSQGSPFLIFHPEKDQNYFHAFNDAFDACKQEESGYEFQLRHALSNILLYCIKANDSPKSNTSILINHRIKQMILWIDDHIEDDISTAHIAKQCNLCVRECQRCFEKALNLSPMEYVRQKRILKAAEWLKQTDMQITEIANRLHFSSSSHFIKVFKEKVGCTPVHYRKQ